MSDRDTSAPDASDPDVGPPAEVSVRRLGDELSREVAEVRVQLREASMRSDAHALSGNLQAAIAARAEQRAILQEFEARLRRKVAEAAVERDVEDVLRGVADDGSPEGLPQDRSRDTAGPVSGPARNDDRSEGSDGAVPLRQLPATVGALLAFTAAVALAAPGADAPSGPEAPIDRPDPAVTRTVPHETGAVTPAPDGDAPDARSDDPGAGEADSTTTPTISDESSGAEDGDEQAPRGLLAGLTGPAPSVDRPPSAEGPTLDIVAPDVPEVTDAVTSPPQAEAEPPPLPEQPDDDAAVPSEQPAADAADGSAEAPGAAPSAEADADGTVG